MRRLRELQDGVRRLAAQMAGVPKTGALIVGGGEVGLFPIELAATVDGEDNPGELLPSRDGDEQRRSLAIEQRAQHAEVKIALELLLLEGEEAGMRLQGVVRGRAFYRRGGLRQLCDERRVENGHGVKLIAQRLERRIDGVDRPPV